MLIAPLRHISDISCLRDEEQLDILKTLSEVKNILTEVLKPQGFNIGINVGELAGAGIAGHLHIHIVPRWKADTNFMPVLYNTKVISQSLEDLYRRINKLLFRKKRRISI